jgi:hypothetical protein
MWIKLIENQEIIKAIYGEQIPSLDKVSLIEVRIVYGEDIQCYLRFDLKILPLKMPEKWTQNNVNTVQLDMALMSSDIVSFATSGGNLIGSIEIVSDNNSKIISFVVEGENIFVIKSKWIHLRTVTGYLNG